MILSQGISHNQGKVCKLKKVLYDLKQTSRAWFEKLSNVITYLGFHPSDHDSISHGCIILSLYVDDMIIIGDNVDEINKLKLPLSKQLEKKDLGTLRYFLGVEVAYSPISYLLSQSKYITNILEQTRLSDTRAVDSLLELSVKYAYSDGIILPDHTYRTLVGSLVYLTITRPDIAYVVHVVRQFIVSPTIVHWTTVLRILRYL